jgi:hypothetical protein
MNRPGIVLLLQVTESRSICRRSIGRWRTLSAPRPTHAGRGKSVTVWNIEGSSIFFLAPIMVGGLYSGSPQFIVQGIFRSKCTPCGLYLRHEIIWLVRLCEDFSPYFWIIFLISYVLVPWTPTACSSRFGYLALVKSVWTYSVDARFSRAGNLFFHGRIWPGKAALRALVLLTLKNRHHENRCTVPGNRI